MDVRYPSQVLLLWGNVKINITKSKLSNTDELDSIDNVNEGSGMVMGNAVHDKKSQLEYLTNRLNLLLNVLDSIDPEEANIDDIDRLLQMLEDLQGKINQFKQDW